MQAPDTPVRDLSEILDEISELLAELRATLDLPEKESK